MMIRRAGFIVVAALFGVLAPATSVLAGQPVTQALNPPPPSFEACMAVGNGTICSGFFEESYSQVDSFIVCGNGANAFDIFDSAVHKQHATRYYDQDGNLTRRFIDDAYQGQWSNPVNGAAIQYNQRNTTIDVLAVPGSLSSATETVTGEVNFTAPRMGAVFLNAGRAVFAPDGSIDFQAGPDDILDYFVDGDASVIQQVCMALGAST